MSQNVVDALVVDLLRRQPQQRRTRCIAAQDCLVIAQHQHAIVQAIKGQGSSGLSRRKETKTNDHVGKGDGQRCGCHRRSPDPATACHKPLAGHANGAKDQHQDIPFYKTYNEALYAAGKMYQLSVHKTEKAGNPGNRFLNLSHPAKFFDYDCAHSLRLFYFIVHR